MSDNSTTDFDLNKLTDMAGDPNFDEMMKNFKLSCPVKKFNLESSEPACIAGMWIISNPNCDIKSKADLENLNDNTFLGFVNQHRLELSKVIFGMMHLLVENKFIAESNVYGFIVDYLNMTGSIVLYSDYKKSIIDLVSKRFNVPASPSNVIAKFCEILNILPFISYGDIDSIATEGIEMFKKSMENIKNE